jgi:hypothetical protein
MRLKALILCAFVFLMAMPLSATAQSAQCKREDLSARVRLDRKSYPPGETVKIRLIVTNTSGSTCRVVFPNGRKATFEILDGDAVVKDDRCRAYTDAIIEEEWEAGHREVYRFRWGQRKTADGCDGRGERAGPGSYDARGLFDGAREGTFRTKRHAFIIGD